MMLVKFLTSANQKYRIWSCDESRLCYPWPRLLGDEVVVGPSLMFRKMDPWNVIRNILQDKTNKNQLSREMVLCWSNNIFDKVCFFIRNTWMYGTSTGRSYSNKNNTEAICEWRLYCGKYVMNRTDLELVCYSKFCNQYIASMNYPYKTFRQFFLAQYSTQISYCFC